MNAPVVSVQIISGSLFNGSASAGNSVFQNSEGSSVSTNSVGP